MNCAWCGANNDGSDSHGVCDACMQTIFGIDPASIHDEITTETKTEEKETVEVEA